MANSIVSLSDVDLEENIHHAVSQYPPLVQDRSHFSINVHAGQVVVWGYVRTAITRVQLVQRIENVPGVAGLDTSKLYSDDKLRLAVGHLVPAGMQCNVYYGQVKLSGNAPEAAADLMEKVQAVEGVREVRADW
jgi:osmotically-inducible protein OsmY